MSSGEQCSPLPPVESRQPAGLCKSGPRPEGVRDCMMWPLNAGPGIEVVDGSTKKGSYLPKKAALGKSQTRGFRLPSISATSVRKAPISMESVGLALCGWPGSDDRRNEKTYPVQRLANGIAERTVLQNGETTDHSRDWLPPTSDHSIGGNPQHDFLCTGGNKASHKLSNVHNVVSSANARVNKIGAKLELTRDGVRMSENGQPKLENINNHNETIAMKYSVDDKKLKPDKMALPTSGKHLLSRKPRARLLQRVRVSQIPADNMGDIMAHRYLTDYIERQAEANKRRHLADTERLNAKRRAKIVRGNKTSELRANRPKVLPIPDQQRMLWKMSKFTKKAQPHFTTVRRGLTQSQCEKSAASGGSAGEMSQDGADTLSEGTPASSLANNSPDVVHSAAAQPQI